MTHDRSWTEPPEDGDWARWSQEAVQGLEARNAALLERHGLRRGAKYRWDLATASIHFDVPGADGAGAASVTFAVQCVGSHSTSAGTFVWGWANDTLPAASTARMAEVRAFGDANDLQVLLEPEWQGGHDEALEVLAAAGRVLDADGFWIAPHDDGALYFLLFETR